MKGSLFYIVWEIEEWKVLKNEWGEELFCWVGVSLFGIGGVNVYVIIEEYILEVVDEIILFIIFEYLGIFNLLVKNEVWFREYV